MATDMKGIIFCIKKTSNQDTFEGSADRTHSWAWPQGMLELIYNMKISFFFQNPKKRQKKL